MPDGDILTTLHLKCVCGAEITVEKIPWFRTGVDLDWWIAAHKDCVSRLSGAEVDRG